MSRFKIKISSIVRNSMGIVQSHGKTDSEIYNQNELLRSQNQELKKQIKSLKEIIDKDKNNLAIAKKELEEQEKTDKKEKLEEFYNNLDSSIDKYVNEMLKDDEINSVIPDYIEKKIYKNVFTLVLKLVRNITDSTSIKFLDQELKITLDSKK